MAKRKFHLTPAQQQELQAAFLACKDGPARTRLQAVWLYGSDEPLPRVLRLTGSPRSSLMVWCARYRQAGWTGLLDKRLGGNHTKLTSEQRQDLMERLHQYTPRQLFGTRAATASGQFWTVPDLCQAVERWYGVTYAGRSSYTALFATCQFSYQRTEKVFKSRRPAQVAAFEEQLEKNSSTRRKTPRRQ